MENMINVASNPTLRYAYHAEEGFASADVAGFCVLEQVTAKAEGLGRAPVVHTSLWLFFLLMMVFIPMALIFSLRLIDILLSAFLQRILL